MRRKALKEGAKTVMRVVLRPTQGTPDIFIFAMHSADRDEAFAASFPLRNCRDHERLARGQLSVRGAAYRARELMAAADVIYLVSQSSTS